MPIGFGTPLSMFQVNIGLGRVATTDSIFKRAKVFKKPVRPPCLPDPSPKTDGSNRVFQYAQGFEQVVYSALAFFTEFEAKISIFPAALI